MERIYFDRLYLLKNALCACDCSYSDLSDVIVIRVEKRSLYQNKVLQI